MALPEEPDAPRSPGAPLSAERAPHRRPRLVLLVALGGAIGTAARYLLTQSFPAAAEPGVILAINVVGAFALGLLLESLASSGRDTGRRLTARVTLGTGLLGGFTTYSALALDTLDLSNGSLLGAVYALATLLLGILAAFSGVLLAGRRRT